MEVLKVTPAGSAPVSLSVGVGEPVAVTVNESSAPMPKVTVLALVMTASLTDGEREALVASVPTPLCAVKVMG